MALFDDDQPKKVAAHVVGQDISLMSVAELTARIGDLKAEIERLERERAARGETRTAAEALFRR